MSDAAECMITVVFKTEKERQEHYTISSTERDRLAQDFTRSHYTDTPKLGVYDVTDDHGNPRKLMLRFIDVLFIG